MPEEKPTNAAEEGACQIKLHCVAFETEKSTVHFFKTCDIVLNGKNQKNLTSIFFVNTTKKIIAADAKNGVSEFVIAEDMKSDNPLLGKKIPNNIDNSNLSPSQARVD
eukprot:12858158-Ditylum_brightwellii.AAC.1